LSEDAGQCHPSLSDLGESLIEDVTAATRNSRALLLDIRLEPVDI
jgi:hypothetical protein